MSAESLHRFLKALLWLFNLVYGLFGFITLICGASAVALFNTDAMKALHKFLGTYGVFGNRDVMASAALLTAVGIFILVTSIFGCVMLLRYTKRSMIAYIAFVSVIMIMQFAASFASITLINMVPGNIRGKLRTLGNLTSNQEDMAGPTALMKNIQETWQCCGVTNYTDWMRVKWFSETYSNYSITNKGTKKVGFIGCCKDFNEDTQDYCDDRDTKHCCSEPTLTALYPPCAPIITNHLLHTLGIVAGAGLTFAFLEICLLVVSCLFVRSSNQDFGMERLGS